MNKAIVCGNLGADPETRHTQGGQSVCNFNVATSEAWIDKTSGEKKEKTEWHRVTVWGQQSEACGKYLTKGAKVLVEGTLQTRQWQDKEGVTQHTTEIRASRVQFLTPKASGSAESRPADSGKTQAAKASDPKVSNSAKATTKTNGKASATGGPPPAPPPSDDDAPAGGSDEIPF